MASDTTVRTFTAALAALVADLKEDRSVLAVVLCGSLSHDTVWEKSDIDLAVVTVDDRKIEGGMVAINASGINALPKTVFPGRGANRSLRAANIRDQPGCFQPRCRAL